MEYCYVKFKPANNDSLERIKTFFDLIKAEKDSTEEPNEQALTEYLSESEKDYFWRPSDEERREWEKFWLSTPVEIRLSPQMPSPPWHLESMYDAFWNGDYDFISVTEESNCYHLNFYPHGYPYGGTDSMVALVECFGHEVLGIEDGTGYSKYACNKTAWKPKKDMETMEIHGQIKEKDYVAAQFVHVRPRPLLAVFGILLLAAAVWAMFNGSGTIIGAALAYFSLYFLIFIPYSAKKNYRLYQAISDPVTVTIQEGGINFKRENAEGLVKWSEIVKWRQSKNLILLYPTNNVFYLLPSHLFSSEDRFDEFKLLLTSKCGNAR
jgi:YcxB-like protein